MKVNLLNSQAILSYQSQLDRCAGSFTKFHIQLVYKHYFNVTLHVQKGIIIFISYLLSETAFCFYFIVKRLFKKALDFQFIQYIDNIKIFTIQKQNISKHHNPILEHTQQQLKSMPKVRKFKKYDYSKSYDEIRSEDHSRSQRSEHKSQISQNQSQTSQPYEDDCSAKRRGRRFKSKLGLQKSEDARSVVSHCQSKREQHIEDNVDELSNCSHPISYQIHQINEEDSVNRCAPVQHYDLFEGDTQPIIQKDQNMLLFIQNKHEKIEKNQKKQKRNEQTMTIQSKPEEDLLSQSQQKIEFRQFVDDLAFSQMEVQQEDEQNYPQQDNEEFILEFNPDTTKQNEPMEVFRSSFIYNNDYIRVEVYLQKRRKIIEERIRALIARKHSQNIQSTDGHPHFKTQFSKDQLKPREGTPLRRRKKRRTVVTAKVLEQVQLMFRHYEQQQKFYGTPCYRRKLTLRSIADNLIISPTQVKHLYDQFTTDPLFTMRFAKLEPVDGKGGAVSQQLLQIRLKFIEQMVGKNCVMTQQEIADQMNQCQELLTRDRNGHLIPINRKMVQTLLRKGNYSRKKVQMVPKNRNSPQTVQNRYHYCQKYIQLLAIPTAEIYFLDESRFNMMTVRDRGWAKKGIPATKTTVNSKGKDIILLAIISITGLVWSELSDGYNAAAFTISMDKVGKMLNQRGPNPHRYIIMDNCPIHNRQNLRNIEQLHNLKIIYLPPYTPMLNPIEYWFNEVKSNLRQKTYKTRLQMKNNLEAILSRYKQKSFENYYDCIKPYLELGIRRELCK